MGSNLSAGNYVDLMICVFFRFKLSHNTHSFLIYLLADLQILSSNLILSAHRPFLAFITLHKSQFSFLFYSLLLNCHLLLVLLGTCSNYFKPMYGGLFCNFLSPSKGLLCLCDPPKRLPIK